MPGETVESCVRREVAEEVGVVLREVRYAGSQHWPFGGGQLMVGCHGHTDQTEVRPADEDDGVFLSRGISNSISPITLSRYVQS